LWAGWCCAGEAGVLKEVKRIVFLGDSITYGGLYIEYIEAYLATRWPERRIEIINLGLPSETTSGLTEAGHAGGAFPRPCVHERLERVLEKSRPDLVVACYGINDGIYMPLSEERFERYREGMRRLVEKVRGAGARVMVLTPPPFDAVALKGKTSATGEGAPYRDYDQVLEKYAQWLLDQRGTAAEAAPAGGAGWDVVDVHGAMNRHVAARREGRPGFILAGDGVHTNAFGHWLMAQQVLGAWGAPAEVDEAIVDAERNRATRGDVSEVRAEGGEVRFAWRTRLPMPMDKQWDKESAEIEGIVERFNRHRLVVTGLRGKRYELYEGDALLGTVTREELEKGVDMLRFGELSSNRKSAEVMKLVQQRQRLLKDAWLTEVGHKRPGMAKGLPLDEAKKRGEEIEGKMREAARGVVLKVGLVAEK
jgi:lysophospholipase L1-like esterase